MTPSDGAPACSVKQSSTSAGRDRASAPPTISRGKLSTIGTGPGPKPGQSLRRKARHLPSLRARCDDRHDRARSRTPDLHRARRPSLRSTAEGREAQRTGGQKRRCRLDGRRPPRLRPELLRRPAAARGVPPCDATGSGGGPGARRGRTGPAQVPRPPAGRDHETRHDRRASERPQARSPRTGAALWHAVARQRARPAAVRAEPLHRHPTTALQQRPGPAGARHRPVHQRTAGHHVRAEEQPDQTDGERRGRAVQEGPGSKGEAVRVRPLRGALRGRRKGRSLLHAPPRQGLLVPAVQPGLQRRRRGTRRTRTASPPTTCGARF